MFASSLLAALFAFFPLHFLSRLRSDPLRCPLAPLLAPSFGIAFIRLSSFLLVRIRLVHIDGTGWTARSIIAFSAMW